MKIIGITGPTGAGKSALCQSLKKLNIPCIDADEVYHSLLLPPSECLDALKRSFGNNIFYSDGKLDRARLGEIVFNDPTKLELLNKTVLGHVLNKIREFISDYKRKGFNIVAVDAPTLIESGFHKECSYVWVILASKESRLHRIIERDGLSPEKALARINAQKSDDFYCEHADVVFNNDKTADELFDCVKETINNII